MHPSPPGGPPSPSPGPEAGGMPVAPAFCLTTISQRDAAVPRGRKRNMPFDGFIKIDGIEGESNDSKHKNEIEILSYSWGVSQAITGTASSTGTFTGQRADFSALSFHHQLDKASPKLAA